MSERRWRVAALLLALAGAPGCLMVRGTPEITALETPAGSPAEAVPVHVDLQARVIENGIHADPDEQLERFFHGHLLHRALREAGVMSEPAPRSRTDGLQVRIQVEEVRSGSTVLDVASMATFRLIPSWTAVHYRVRAHAVYRGRVLPPFQAAARATLVQHLLLLPVTPFYAPPGTRARNRSEVVGALARHLAAGLAALQGTRQGGSS